MTNNTAFEPKNSYVVFLLSENIEISFLRRRLNISFQDIKIID